MPRRSSLARLAPPAVSTGLLSLSLSLSLLGGCGHDEANPKAEADPKAELDPKADPDPEPTVRASRPPSTPRNSDLPEVPRETIAARFPGMDVAIVARVSRKDRQATIVWLAFRDDALAGDAVLAVAFRRQGMLWAPIGEIVTLSQSDGRREMEALLGGDRTIVERPCGVPRETLVAKVRAGLKELGEAAREGDRRAVLRTYEALAPAFTFEALAFDALTAEWILSGLRGEPLQIELTEGDGDWFDYKLVRDEGSDEGSEKAGEAEEAEEGRMPLVRCDGGWALGAPLP